jgi:hypothetical protein
LAARANPDRCWQAITGSSGSGGPDQEGTTTMRRTALSRRSLGVVLAVTAGAGIGLGSLSACGSGGGTAAGVVPAAATHAHSALAGPASAASSAPAAPLTAAQAAAIAVRTSPGTVTEVDQDVESTGPVFDVKVQHTDGSETKVEVAANTGTVISTETDAPDGQNEPQDQIDQPDAGH